MWYIFALNYVDTISFIVANAEIPAQPAAVQQAGFKVEQTRLSATSGKTNNIT